MPVNCGIVAYWAVFIGYKLILICEDDAEEKLGEKATEYGEGIPPDIGVADDEVEAGAMLAEGRPSH